MPPDDNILPLPCPFDNPLSCQELKDLGQVGLHYQVEPPTYLGPLHLTLEPRWGANLAQKGYFLPTHMGLKWAIQRDTNGSYVLIAAKTGG